MVLQWTEFTVEPGGQPRRGGRPDGSRTSGGRTSARVDTLLREAEDGPRATVSALTRHLHIYEDHIRRLTTENASLRADLKAHSDVAIIHPTAQQAEA
ncbi:hypothetical protein ACFVYV_01430 [Streptomyces mirabilis]|uniref:hypothetical protein n=1 Tax=Streptomyces mirabilis TaxID=68239 RepID=UPI0036DD7978